MGRHRTGPDSGEEGSRTSAPDDEFNQWLGHVTGGRPELTYRWPEETAPLPATEEDQPAIHPAYRWDSPPKRAGEKPLSVVEASPSTAEELPSAAADQPTIHPAYRWDLPLKRAGEERLAATEEHPGNAEHSGSAEQPGNVVEFGEKVRREAPARLGRAALLSGLSVLAAVGITFASVRLMGDRTDLIMERPPEAAPVVSPLVTFGATPFAAPEEAPSDSPPPAEAEPEPEPTATRQIPQAKPTPSRTASAKPTKSPASTPTSTPSAEDTPNPISDARLTQGDEPTDPPSQQPTTRAAPAVTVGFEVVREDADGYTARVIIHSAGQDLSSLRVAVPVSGEILTVDGAEWDARRGRLIISSAAPLPAGEELVVELTATGVPRPPSDCVLAGGDCAITGPPAQ